VYTVHIMTTGGKYRSQGAVKHSLSKHLLLR